MKFLYSLALLFSMATIPAAAELTYTATKVVFSQPGSYTQIQLEGVAGIHAGTKFTETNLGEAAQRLVDTGFFEDVEAKLETRGSSVTVDFDVKPIGHAQMVHVGFENFVWLSHAEIESALQAKSPLFQDYLFENSALLTDFDAALTDALAAKGIPAKVIHLTIEPTLARPERCIEFRIVSPSVFVANMKLGGVATELVPLIQKSVNATAKTSYNEGLGGQTSADRILAPLLDAGYIQATLSNVTLEPGAISANAAPVVLSAKLTSGDVFRVSSIAFAGSPLLSAEAFAPTLKLHPGDIAARALLLESLAPLDAAYRRQGYMDVIVDAVPTVDLITHQVAYTVSVKSGEQYRIRELTAKNLDPAARADFDRGFHMTAGALYNPEYVSNFLKNNTALQALEGYRAGFKAYADPNTHTVDLVLTFVRGAAR